MLYFSFQQKKKLFHWFDKFRLNREALPVKTAKSTFVTFFVLSGAASSFICEIFSFVTVANQEAILLRTYANLGSLVARGLEMNQRAP